MTIQKTDAILGTYRRLPVENPWHIGTISYRNSSEKVLQWTNDAGISWDLFADFDQNILKTSDDNPYFDSGWREFKLEKRDGELNIRKLSQTLGIDPKTINKRLEAYLFGN